MMDLSSLAIAEFGFPGPLLDLLVAAILDGSKTSTSSLVVEYAVENESWPRAGQRRVVTDSVRITVAIIEAVAKCRASREEYWQGAEVRAHLRDPHYTVDDSTEVFLEHFCVIEHLGAPS